MMGLSFNPFKSKAVWGLLAAALGALLVELGSPDGLTGPELVTILGALGAGIGIRDAATKPDAPPPPPAGGGE